MRAYREWWCSGGADAGASGGGVRSTTTTGLRSTDPNIHHPFCTSFYDGECDCEATEGMGVQLTKIFKNGDRLGSRDSRSQYMGRNPRNG